MATRRPMSSHPVLRRQAPSRLLSTACRRAMSARVAVRMGAPTVLKPRRNAGSSSGALHHGEVALRFCRLRRLRCCGRNGRKARCQKGLARSRRLAVMVPPPCSSSDAATAESEHLFLAEEGAQWLWLRLASWCSYAAALLPRLRICDCESSCRAFFSAANCLRARREEKRSSTRRCKLLQRARADAPAASRQQPPPDGPLLQSWPCGDAALLHSARFSGPLCEKAAEARRKANGGGWALTRRHCKGLQSLVAGRHALQRPMLPSSFESATGETPVR